jgi:flagellar protein FliO/FliZ
MSITSQTLLVVALFVVALATLPWAIKWLQRRVQGGMAMAGPNSRLVGALAVGPQQRVVTVEVGPAGARVWLVLGVTTQTVNLLHTLPATGGDFAGALVKAEAAVAPAPPSTVGAP